MIEMEYKFNGESKVLVDDRYKNYRYVILSIKEEHPCAYIELPKGHPLYELDYKSSVFDNMPVHGGCTYSRSRLALTDIHNSWVVGWDYAHLFDYIAMPPDFEINPDDHKWTVKEIIEQDIIPAIDWLIEVNK